MALLIYVFIRSVYSRVRIFFLSQFLIDLCSLVQTIQTTHFRGVKSRNKCLSIEIDMCITINLHSRGLYCIVSYRPYGCVVPDDEFDCLFFSFLLAAN